MSINYTQAGSFKVSGCRITWGSVSWIITSGGTFLTEKHTYAEAEAFAATYYTTIRARVNQLQEERAMTRAEHQLRAAGIVDPWDHLSTDADEAQRLGIRCTGEDEDGEATYD